MNKDRVRQNINRTLAELENTCSEDPERFRLGKVLRDKLVQGGALIPSTEFVKKIMVDMGAPTTGNKFNPGEVSYMGQIACGLTFLYQLCYIHERLVAREKEEGK